MITKLRKGLQYIGVRLYELKICYKEYIKGSKLNSDAFQAFFENGMLVEVHSVEKGLCLRHTQPGHSGKAANNLLNKLFSYINRGYDINSFAFQETLRIIMAYVDYQRQFDTSAFTLFQEIERKYDVLAVKLGEAYMKDLRVKLQAGAVIVEKEKLLCGENFDFESFISSRRSIRMYKKKKVDEEQIEQAVKVANMSPSACNRQPSYVYFSNEDEIVNKIDELITGSSGFKGETPNYIIVTTDRARFMKEEQFQWYINGGIYLSYLTLALHSLGIGFCIMQWKAFYKTERELKSLLGISAHEAIIAVVGCGYYQEETKCICAQRKEVGETLHVVR